MTREGEGWRFGVCGVTRHGVVEAEYEFLCCNYTHQSTK
jgi:hypothetical protein